MFKAVNVGIIKRKNKYLIAQRDGTREYPLLWEFPGGKLNKGESYLECIERELSEELDIEIFLNYCESIWSGPHPDFPEFFINFWLIGAFGGEPQRKIHLELRWETKEEILKRDDLINDLMKHVLHLI